MKVITLPIAAEAYKKNQTVYLTHAVVIEGRELIKVLCNKVKLESILDDMSIATHEVPTCSYCQKKLLTLNIPVLD